MDQNFNNILLKEIAVIQSKLDDTRADIQEIKIENKENFNEILALKEKQSEMEKEIQLLKQKVEHNQASQEKKWDIPTKILTYVVTAVATAFMTLILK